MSEHTTAERRAVCVAGLGDIGAGLTHVLAAAGHEVIALVEDDAAVRAGVERIGASLDRAVGRDEPAPTDRDRVMGRIQVTTRVDDLRDVDLVLEALETDLDATVERLVAILGRTRNGCAVATTSSILSVTELAAALPDPTRVAGFHVFAPVPDVDAIEVVAALQTSEELLEGLETLVAGLPDKVAVRVDDRPGFLLDALVRPYLNDVISEFADGLATAEDLDVALRLGLGYRSGPLERLDRVGLDEHLRTTEALHRATGDSRYAPPPLLRAMVAAGHLGEKTGRGFHLHENKEH